MAQKIFVAVENSSLFDIALNTYGSVDFIGKLIEDNPENGLNLYPDAGTQFVWDDSLQISQTNAIIGGSGMFVGQKYATRPLDEPQANYAPQNILPPTLAGAISVGSTLTCIPGAWSGLPTPTTSFQWQSSTDGGVSWGDITGETNSTYIIQPTDDGKLIRCNQIATNSLGTAERASAFVAPYTAVSSSVPPSNSTAPTIVVCGGGSAIVGAYLVASIGTWLGDSPIAYSFVWKRGSTTVGTSIFYQVQSADYGQTLKCEVTATNGFGNATAITSGVTGLSIPVNTVAPVISGGTAVGVTLSTTNGTWTGNATITYAYQWLRNGSAISSATSSTYTLTLSDMSQVITCRVTGTNSYGNASAISNSITATKIPSNTTSPVPYGLSAVGSVLSVFTGVWSEYPSSTKTYNWQYSSDNGSTWNNYSPASTGATYTIVSGDLGNLIRCQVTATNSDGNATANSESFSVPAPTTQRPNNTVAPVVSGTPSIGQTLSTTNGTWANTPTSYAYQWLRGGSTISGATNSTYTLVTADTNLLITCRVTATNSGGSEAANGNDVYAYDADFYAVITFATAQGYTLPTTAQLQKFSQMVKELKDNSMWTIMDRFWWMANNGSSDFGRINWVSPSTGTLLTLVNSPTWISNVGFISTGTSYLDTQYNPSTQGVNYTLNNAGRYCFITLRATASGQINIDGANTNTNRNVMYVATGQNNHHINQDTNTGTGINTSCNSYHCITRTGASVSQRSTDLSQSLNIASTSIFNGNQHIMRSAQVAAIAGNGYGYYAIGGAIPSGDLATHRSIINKYMNNL